MRINKFLIIFSLLAVLGFMVACGNQDNQVNTDQKPENNTEKPQDNSEEPNNNSDETKDNFNETGFPIVEDEITLKFFTSEFDASPNWNDDFPAWTAYEEMTNIKVDWVEQVDKGSLDEKRNLILAGGDLPDAFFASYFTNADLLKYGDQGTFIDLKDLIDEYAPNLKKMMEEDPTIEKGITFPDGNIYALPNMMEKEFYSMRMGPLPWIDKTWLDRLDMEVPETTDEFYEFLTAVKENDPDTIPYGARGITYLINHLNGSFGLNVTEGSVVDLDPNDDDLRFVPTSDEYREMLTYLHKLFDEELIAPNIFTIEPDQFSSNAVEGKYASIGFYTPHATLEGENAEKFISFFPLKGPNGDQLYTGIRSPLALNGQFVITDTNPNPAETMRWIDFFYGDEGSRLMFLGIEDESFVEEDGEYKYSDTVLKAEGASGPGQKMREFAPGGGINPPGVTKQKYFIGSESHEEAIKAADRIKSYLPDEIWPEFTYTEEENSFMTSVGKDIEKYVTEKRDQFIAGAEPLNDENWDKYVKTFEDMNLEKYMEIKKAAYDRYNSN